MTLLAALFGACGSAGPPTLAEAAPVWVDQRCVDEGQAITLHGPAGTVVPEVDGLSVVAAAVAPDGSATWELRAAKGSYVVEVPVSKGEPTRLFLDFGVDGPSGGPMEDLVAVPPPERPIWPLGLAVVALLVAVAVAAALLWRRFRPVPPPPPPERPDRLARREWAALRQRSDLSADDLAGGLSSIYRRYLESVHRWPATSRTSREILDTLAGDLPAVQLERARRLLFAMDIVRFSERSAHEGFFSALDTDFEALLMGSS